MPRPMPLLCGRPPAAALVRPESCGPPGLIDAAPAAARARINDLAASAPDPSVAKAASQACRTCPGRPVLKHEVAEAIVANETRWGRRRPKKLAGRVMSTRWHADRVGFLAGRCVRWRPSSEPQQQRQHLLFRNPRARPPRALVLVRRRLSSMCAHACIVPHARLPSAGTAVIVQQVPTGLILLDRCPQSDPCVHVHPSLLYRYAPVYSFAIGSFSLSCSVAARLEEATGVVEWSQRGQDIARRARGSSRVQRVACQPQCGREA
ncbi:hypothetical protein BJY59DRAFT_707278 [Rhodotorula toruloides]